MPNIALTVVICSIYGKVFGVVKKTPLPVCPACKRSKIKKVN